MIYVYYYRKQNEINLTPSLSPFNLTLGIPLYTWTALQLGG